MRAREIREIQNLLLAGESVRLVAPRGTGRSYLLDQVARDMESRGFTAFRVSGRRPFQDQPYVALREAGLVSLRSAHSESDVADELSHGLAPVARPLILIDDADTLDVSSAYLLEQVSRRRGVPIVAVAPPFIMLDAHGRAAMAKMQVHSRVELTPLGYAQINLLAQQVLGTPAQPEVVAQVLSMSSGLTGTAVSILRSAAREHRIVQHESGWALHGTSLWNVHLRNTVEQLISGLHRDEFRVLHALALAESADTESFHRVASAELIGLSQRGLLTTFAGDSPGTQIAPRPALITEYFQHQPIDPLHYEAMGLLRTLDDPAAQDRAERCSSEQLARAKTFDLTENRGTGRTRFLHSETTHRLAAAAREWHSDRSLAHAVAYLDLLLSSDTYISIAAAVLEHTPRTGDSPLAIRLAMHHGFWLTQTDTERSRGALRAFVAGEPEPKLQVALAAFEAYLLFLRWGMDPAVAQWWDGLAELQDGFSRAMRHYIGVVSGRIDEPLGVDQLEPEFELQTFVVHTANTVLRARHASSETYERELRTEFAAARAASDHRRVAVTAYFLAQQEAATFRDLLATETVNVTLALGTPNLAFAHYFAAQLRWGAYLHYVHGEPDLARSVLAEADRYPGVHGALPAMHPDFGAAIQLLISGEVDRAAELLVQTSVDCHAALLGDAAWTYAVVAFHEQPTAAVFAQLQRVAGASSHGTPALMRVLQGALDADPELPQIAQWVTQDTEIATAISLISAVFRERQGAPGETPDPFAPVLAETVHELRGMLASGIRAVVPEPPTAHVASPLTRREREIAMLAVTLQNREIAERLSLSVRTVENHLARAMKKLGVGSRAGLAAASSLLG